MLLVMLLAPREVSMENPTSNAAAHRRGDGLRMTYRVHSHSWAWVCAHAERVPCTVNNGAPVTRNVRSVGRPRRKLDPAPVVTVLVLICSTLAQCAALPAGCTVSGTTLTSCSGFQGSDLELSSQGLTAIAPGAFASMSTTVTTL